MKTADKKIVNHLRLIIQVYEASDKSKIALRVRLDRIMNKEFLPTRTQQTWTFPPAS